MGASQSAHKLTVTNEDEGESVIQVSHALVQRLKKGLTETSSDPEDVRVQRSSKPASPAGGAAPLPPGGVPPGGYPSYYYPEYTISALQMQKQKEAELDEQDEYWKKRVLNLEKKHEQINNILDCEYKKAVAEYTDEKSAGCGDVMTPCIESSQKIAQCYQDHPKQALKCSSLVEEFSNCVDQCRIRILTARC